MRLWPLALIVLAGCFGDLPSVDLAIEGGPLDIDDTVSFDAESRPTAPLYADNGKDHPDFYSLHDLLFGWASPDHELETEWFDESFGYGFALCGIDGFPPRQESGETRGCFERGGFWAIEVDGEGAELGISDLEVKGGQAIRLEWTTFSA